MEVVESKIEICLCYLRFKKTLKKENEIEEDLCLSLRVTVLLVVVLC